MSKSKEGSAIFISNLRRLIEGKNITQNELAKAIDVTQGMVSNWLRGTNYPRIHTMQRLADYFEVPITALTSQIDDPMTAEIADLFRKLSAEDKALILALIRRLAQDK